MTFARVNKTFRWISIGVFVVCVVSLYVISTKNDVTPLTDGDAFYHAPPTQSTRRKPSSSTPLTLTFDLVESEMGNNSVLLRGRGPVGGGEGDVTRPEVRLKIAVGGMQWLALKDTMQEAEEQVKAAKLAVQTTAFPWKPVKEKRVDCSRLFAGDLAEQKKAELAIEMSPGKPLTASSIRSAASKCQEFTKDFGFITNSLTQEEEDFPIAFSLLIFKDLHQVVNLLRAIYRPQNYYCIHVDNKTEAEFRDAVKAVAGCFPNIFISSRSVDVQWGTMTVLEPELICMEDLWRLKRWKYFINLTGQEFPLRTNWELVHILKAYNGANNLEGTRNRANKARFQTAGTPPAGIQPTKGSVHITVNRDFVDFVLYSKVSQDFLNWTRHVDVPDETFFSSLNHNPHLGIKGAYLGEPETHPDNYPFLTRFKNWGTFPFDYPCAGQRVRLVCILSVGDLPLLNTRHELFANKFYADYSEIAYGCMAERLYNNTRDEFLVKKDFDISYYAKMPYVTNMVKESNFTRLKNTPA